MENTNNEKAEAELAQTLREDAPKLLGVLKGMACGLIDIQNNLNSFLTKLKGGEFSTKNGISYLESKYLLLMFYCQSVMFYILLKAEGRSVKNHPVIERLIEIRLFLEKIRPIDTKLQYQIEKLLKLASGSSYTTRGEADEQEEDALMYKPNPDMLVSKIDENDKEKCGIYRPPMIAPTTMDEERSPKSRKAESRVQKEALQKASRSAFIKELANELEGKPEEVREYVGSESKEMSRELSRLEARAQQEENLFARVPLSRVEKKRLKHLKRSQNGLLGMLDSFDDDVANMLDMENKSSNRSDLDRSKPEELPQTFSKLRKPKKTTNFKRQKGLTSKKPSQKPRKDERMTGAAMLLNVTRRSFVTV